MRSAVCGMSVRGAEGEEQPEPPRGARKGAIGCSAADRIPWPFGIYKTRALNRQVSTGKTGWESTPVVPPLKGR